jgi:glycosyltransferase involved in cell wall biosynthesis
MICRLADKIVAVTPNVSAYIKNLGIEEKRIIVIRNGVNTDHFKPIKSDVCKTEIGLNHTYRYIGFVGSLTHWQGVDDLIIAFSQITNNSKVILLVIGDGAEKGKLEALARNLNIEDQIVFTGITSYDLIPNYISACDFMVAPKKELDSGFSPLKVYEYLACGKPVIASDVNGLQFIMEKKVGVTFKPGNVNKLKEAIINMLALPYDTLENMGKRARQIAVNDFSWDRSIIELRTGLDINNRFNSTEDNKYK